MYTDQCLLKLILYVGAIGLGNGFFNSMNLTAGVSHLECTGDEDTLNECNMMSISDEYPCEHHAGVICRGMYIVHEIVSTLFNIMTEVFLHNRIIHEILAVWVCVCVCVCVCDHNMCSVNRARYTDE